PSPEKRWAFASRIGSRPAQPGGSSEPPRLHHSARRRGAAWPLAAAAQSTTQPIQAMTAKLRQIEVVRREAYRPSCSNAVSIKRWLGWPDEGVWPWRLSKHLAEAGRCRHLRRYGR